jgi:hypothetical protein
MRGNAYGECHSARRIAACSTVTLHLSQLSACISKAYFYLDFSVLINHEAAGADRGSNCMQYTRVQFSNMARAIIMRRTT